MKLFFGLLLIPAFFVGLLAVWNFNDRVECEESGGVFVSDGTCQILTTPKVAQTQTSSFHP